MNNIKLAIDKGLFSSVIRQLTNVIEKKITAATLSSVIPPAYCFLACEPSPDRGAF